MWGLFCFERERRPRERQNSGESLWCQCACCCLWFFFFSGSSTSAYDVHSTAAARPRLPPTLPNCISLLLYFYFHFFSATTMRDCWKEIHKNVNFSGGNIIYVKHSGWPTRGDRGECGGATDSDAATRRGGSTAVIAVLWIGIAV